MIKTQNKRRSDFILKGVLTWFLIMMSMAYIGDYFVESFKEEPDYQSITRILYLTIPFRTILILFTGFILYWMKWEKSKTR